MKMKRIMVLASGGIDSSVLLHKAIKEVGPDNVIALCIYYGQKHHTEMNYCKWTCNHLKVRMITADLADVFKYDVSCSLLQNSTVDISEGDYADQIKKGTLNTYVPFRNGLFLAYATSVALQLDIDTIYYGAHKDDAAGNAYPDCSHEFIEHMSIAINQGSGHKVHLEAPWWNMNKADVVRKGVSLGMNREDFEHTWSCYKGDTKPCGKCGTCIDRKKAFEESGIYDIG